MSANPPKVVPADMKRLVTNLMLAREKLMGRLQDQSGNRDLDKECRYPDGMFSVETYRRLFEEDGIANRVVGVYPDECWQVYPELYETVRAMSTSFERRWQELLDRPGMNPWHYLHRADELSGVGHFGCLLLGLDDGRALDRRVYGLSENNVRIGRREHDLLYLRAFDQSQVRIKELNNDPGSPRYGQPLMYTIEMVDTSSGYLGNTTQSVDVHWTRVIHLADNRKSSEVVGTPRLKPVVRRIFDLKKILGSSAEMFYKGGFPGYSVESTGDGSEIDLDEESIKEQFQLYEDGLQRYLALTNMTAKSLAPQVADPTNHLLGHYQYIAATVQTPLRIMLGSEAGHLASTQDLTTWNKRVAKRQHLYLDPMVIFPFVDRLMKVGVLPTVPTFYTSWTDLNALTEKDKADVTMKRTQALLQYVTSGAETVVSPLDYLTLFLGFTLQQAEAILAAAVKNAARPKTKQVWQKPAAGMAKKPDSAGSTTRRTSRNGLGRR